MKSVLVIFALTGILFVNQAIGQTSEKEHRIVFHLASADTLVHKALVKQLGNVMDYWKTAKIEVVVHNAGVGFMKKDEAILSKEIELLKERGIIFAVCENTLKQRKIAKNQILPAAVFVPVGLAEIVLKQEDGWAYIKAGF